MTDNTAQFSADSRSSHKRGDLFPPLQRAETVLAIDRSERVVVCRHGKRTNADWTALLSLRYRDVELVIRCSVLQALQSQEAALRSLVALGLHSRLNSKRYGSSSRKGQPTQHNQVRPLAKSRSRCCRAPYKLNKVRREINAPIETLAGRVVPVPVLDVEKQIICHLEAPSQSARTVLGLAAAAAAADAPEALGFCVRVQCGSFSWGAPLDRSCYFALTAIATSGQPTNTEKGTA